MLRRRQKRRHESKNKSNALRCFVSLRIILFLFSGVSSILFSFKSSLVPNEKTTFVQMVFVFACAAIATQSSAVPAPDSTQLRGAAPLPPSYCLNVQTQWYADAAAALAQGYNYRSAAGNCFSCSGATPDFNGTACVAAPVVATSTSCSGSTLMQNWSDGTQTVISTNAPSCGYVVSCSSNPSASMSSACPAGFSGSYTFGIENATCGTGGNGVQPNGTILNSTQATSCTPVPSSCPGGPTSWGSGCAGNIAATASGSSASASNTNPGFTGTISGTCNSGTWAGMTSSCVATPPPPSSCSGGSTSWGNCSGSFSGAAHGGSMFGNNTVPGYTGSISGTCSNGSWIGIGTTCVANAPYITNTTCSGLDLMNQWSNGTQTLSQANSPACGWTPPPQPPTGGTLFTFGGLGTVPGSANLVIGPLSGSWSMTNLANMVLTVGFSVDSSTATGVYTGSCAMDVSVLRTNGNGSEDYSLTAPCGNGVMTSSSQSGGSMQIDLGLGYLTLQANGSWGSSGANGWLSGSVAPNVSLYSLMRGGSFLGLVGMDWQGTLSGIGYGNSIQGVVPNGPFYNGSILVNGQWLAAVFGPGTYGTMTEGNIQLATGGISGYTPFFRVNDTGTADQSYYTVQPAFDRAYWINYFQANGLTPPYPIVVAGGVSNVLYYNNLPIRLCTNATGPINCGDMRFNNP